MKALAGAVALAFLALPLTAPAVAQDAPVWGPVAPERVAGGLAQPVDVAFGRDGYAYYVELTGGAVRRVDLASGTIDPEPVASLPDVYAEPFTETGLFGLALHPEFHDNGILYVSYVRNDTAEGGGYTNVLSEVQYGNETVLAERPGNLFHNGGRVLVADGFLWWTSGDATNPFTDDPATKGAVAQDPNDLRGKVMRFTLDGAPAPENPWGNAAWTLGHRNVYGIAWDPENARLFVTENGNAEADELNVLAAGANYGWPECEGACDPPREGFTEPIYAWEGTVAPTGADWFRGAFWFGTFNQGDLMRASDRSGAWVVEKVHHYPGNEDMPPRVLDVEVGPDGTSLWFTTWDELWRVGFPDDPAYPAEDPRAEEPYWWQPEHPRFDGPGEGEGETDPDDPPPEGAEGWVLPFPGAGAVLIVIVLAGALLARRETRR